MTREQWWQEQCQKTESRFEAECFGISEDIKKICRECDEIRQRHGRFTPDELKFLRDTKLFVRAINKLSRSF